MIIDIYVCKNNLKKWGKKAICALDDRSFLMPCREVSHDLVWDSLAQISLCVHKGGLKTLLIALKIQNILVLKLSSVVGLWQFFICLSLTRVYYGMALSLVVFQLTR